MVGPDRDLLGISGDGQGHVFGYEIFYGEIYQEDTFRELWAAEFPNSEELSIQLCQVDDSVLGMNVRFLG